MGNLITGALVLGALVGIPALALRGESRRGVYIAVALVAAFFSYTCNDMSGVSTLPPNPTAADIEGAKLMEAMELPFILITGAIAFGCFIGAAIYRTSHAGTKVCPHCAERSLAAAAICRFCGRPAETPAVVR